MEVSTLLIIAVLIVLLSVWFSNRKIVKNPLPGPYGLPFVGYIPFMTFKPHIKLTELSKIYGPVYSIRLGCQNIVVICDYKLIKEAFSSEVFIGRPPDLPIDFSEETMRTGAMQGPSYKEQRRFALHMLRALGVGKSRIEEYIKEEIMEALERMADVVGPIIMSDILAPSISNNIANVLFGKRLKYDDPKRQKLDIAMTEVGRLASALNWQTFYPWIKAFTIKFNIGVRAKISRSIEAVNGYCREEVEKHEESLDPNNIRDFMDAYLLEIEKKSDDPNSSFNKDVLVDFSRALLGAGSQTVRIAVDWVLLVLAAYPQVQKKIHNEIDEVLGRDGFPSGQDRLRMPFTEAVILETMRWQTIVPLNLMHYTLRDTELNGYHVPKHSHVLAVYWSVDHDESLWGKDVFEYKPQRFLSEDGKKTVKPEHFTPFSVGKRSCPGKLLAEIEVFLYVAAIFQKFKISLPPGKEADFAGIVGVGMHPKKQELLIELRHK